jgi:biotin transport system substrate-specific component
MMNHSQALIPLILSDKQSQIPAKLQALVPVFGGTLLLALLAQIAIPLPFTPVPITGQTFGLLFVSLLWGARLGGWTLLCYLSLGGLGLPIFSGWSSGFQGATLGYLMGMFFGAIVVGHFADRGWGQSFSKAFFAGLLGLLPVFILGLLLLARFVPMDSLLSAGLYPFLPGALIKLTLAAWVSRSLHHSLKSQL